MGERCEGRRKGTSPGRAMARGKAEDGAHAEDQRTRERQGKKKRKMDEQDGQDEGGEAAIGARSGRALCIKRRRIVARHAADRG